MERAAARRGSGEVAASRKATRSDGCSVLLVSGLPVSALELRAVLAREGSLCSVEWVFVCDPTLSCVNGPPCLSFSSLSLESLPNTFRNHCLIIAVIWINQM